MAINLGLRDSELQELKRLLKKPHWIKVTITIQASEGSYDNDVSNRMLAGQVNFDVSQQVIRSLELTLSDPKARLTMTPGSPEPGAIFMDNIIKVVYSVAPPRPTKWFDIPVFYGPVTGFKRGYNSVDVTAHGKDSLGVVSVVDPKTWKPKNLLTDMIIYVLRNIMGESKYNVNKKKKDNDKDIKIKEGDAPIDFIRKRARTVQCNFFFDGRGVGQLRKKNRTKLHTFDGSNIVGEITTSYNPGSVINAVKVIGGKPKGKKKKKAKGSAVAKRGHPLSPWDLGRKIKKGDKEVIIPRYYRKVIEDSSLTTDKECDELARKELEAGLDSSLQFEFSAIPNPLIEEWDGFEVNFNGINFRGVASKWSLPLTHDGLMSVGVNRKVSWPINRKGKKKGKKNRKGKPERPPKNKGKGKGKGKNKKDRKGKK